VTDPRLLWPDLFEWQAVGMEESVFRAVNEEGTRVYVRPDDGSGPLLERLAGEGVAPVPRVLDTREGWLRLSALPGVPVHDLMWYSRPMDVAAIAAEALSLLQEAGVTHGDLCLPNILGDPDTGDLSGIVDWRYAGRYTREIDVAATVWSCEFNGYEDGVALAVLRDCGWSRVDEEELMRLRRLWLSLSAGP
jgi:aminoglycoside phosphotransferase